MEDDDWYIGPAINTDQAIMILREPVPYNGLYNMTAYNISDDNGNWTKIWDVQASWNDDILIIDDIVFCSSCNAVEAYDIFNGFLLDFGNFNAFICCLI